MCIVAGMRREQDIIAHDNDADFAVMDTDVEQLLVVLRRELGRYRVKEFVEECDGTTAR